MTQRQTEHVRTGLLGAWRLVAWEIYESDGTVSYPLDRDVVGLLIYDDSGHVSAQLVQADQPRFDSEDWRQASPDEMSRAWRGYFGYFGTFTIDAVAGVVTHHIESGWFPNLAGTDQVRSYRFDGDRLILDADTAWGKVHIVWERCR